MPFSLVVREEVLVRSHRRCCVCHEFAGRSVSVHHIIQEADGGPNTIENAVALCLRCHAEAGHFNSRHPLGIKYAPTELRSHRDQWWVFCLSSPLLPSGKRPVLWCKSIGVNDLAPGVRSSITFEFENVGEAHAYDVRVETGIYVSEQKLTSDPPPMIFSAAPSITFLPRGKEMTKTIPFGRETTQIEHDQIEGDNLHVYAYCVVSYNDESRTGSDFDHILKRCALYNPATTFFQNTPFFSLAI